MDLTRKATRPNRTMHIDTPIPGMYIVEFGNFKILEQDWEEPINKYWVFRVYLPRGARRVDMIRNGLVRTIYWERRRFRPDDQSI